MAWDGSSALNRVCFSNRGGGVGAVPVGPRRCWAAGGRWVSPWVLGPLWWGESAGGPQPALPLLCHFPVYRRLVLVSPLVPLEKAELGERWRRRMDRSGEGEMGIRQQLRHKWTRSSVQEHVKIQLNPTVFRLESRLTTIFYGLLINSNTWWQHNPTIQDHWAKSVWHFNHIIPSEMMWL